MKVLALVSGGKDSCFSMLQCLAAGHEIVALGNLRPVKSDEVDSYMYQSVGHQVLDLYAEAIGVPLIRQEITGTALCQDKDYIQCENDEVEDLTALLVKARKAVEFDGVASGAILSNYQRVRVENVCSRLGLVSLAYLWQRNQEELLQEMIDCQMKAIVIKVAALGLDPTKHLGREIGELQSHFVRLKEKYGSNVCGEGGEYETFTLDCPIFNKQIVIDEQEYVTHVDNSLAPVAYINIKRAHLEDKHNHPRSMKENIRSLALKTPLDFVAKAKTGDAKQTALRLIPAYQSDTDFIIPCICEAPSGKVFVSGLMGRGSNCTNAMNTVMTKLQEILTERQMCLDNLISVSLYVNAMENYIDINNVYKRFFGLNPPVRACVETPLPEGIQFIMDCIGLKGSLHNSKNVLHVQSISHWAPANIGPYSQGVRAEDLLYTAGQIALVPGSMQLLESDTEDQSNLALTHINKILEEVGKIELKNVLVAICFVTECSSVAQVKRSYSNLDGNSASLLDVVMVSELPRKADVEWQVIASTNSCQWLKTDLEESTPTLKFRVQKITTDKHAFMLIHVNSSVTDLRKNKWEILDSVSAYIENFIDEQVKYMRIFFKHNVVNFDNIEKLWKNVLKINCNIAVSLIPVIYFEDNCILSLFFYLES